jgi:hypothetical protein
MPSRMTVSMASASPTPSYRQKTASLSIGSSMRLARKPGTSRASATVLPIASAAERTVATVESLVSRPRISSTRGISAGGFMKCIPQTWAGRRVAAARRPMGMEDALDASTAPSPSASSSCPKRASLSHVLADGLDRELGIGSGCDLRRGRDARQHGVRIVALALRSELRERRRDARAARARAAPPPRPRA